MTTTDRFGMVHVKCNNCEKYYPGDMDGCPRCNSSGL